MSFERPTLQTIYQRVIGDIEASIAQKTPILPTAILRVLAKVFAGIVYSTYGYLQWAAKQAFPDSAEIDYLDRWASIWGIQRKPPSFASGDIEVTGEVGTGLLSGSRFVADTGIEYETTAGVTLTLDSGTGRGAATVEVEAISSGEAGNAAASSPLTLIEPVAGMDATALVATGGLAGGADVEDDVDLRSRILARIQAPPQGGTESDYVAWAREVSGVTRAWAYELYDGPGTVGLTFVCDDLADIIPSAQMVADVAAYIETKRPLCAVVTVFAPTEVEIDFTIEVSPDTPEVRASIEAALAAFIVGTAEPGTTIALSQISEVISGAAGESWHVMTVPSSAVIIADDEIGAMGTVTWA